MKTLTENIIYPSKNDFPFSEINKVGFNAHAHGWSWKRTNNTCTLYYIISGSISFLLDKKEYICSETCIFFLDKDETAILSNLSKTKKIELYYITFNFKDNIDFSSFDNIERPIKDDNNKFFKLFRQIHQTHLTEGMLYKIKEFAEFSLLMYELLTHKLNTDEAMQIDLKISKATEFMKINYYKNITVKELSCMSGYSISHFRRLFVKNYGISPQEYMLNYKIKKAKEFLSDGQNKSIEEISELVGMCNASYFCKIFKQKTGLTPHKYKKAT